MIFGRTDSTRGERIAIYSIDNGEIADKWLGEDRKYHPWKIRLSDIDGDSVEEVIVSVWKKAKFHPIMTNRSRMETKPILQLAVLFKAAAYFV